MGKTGKPIGNGIMWPIKEALNKFDEEIHGTEEFVITIKKV
jgi:hypothetical protein